MMGTRDFRYHPFYCEENVWHLCQHPAMTQRDLHVIFIFGTHAATPLWCQRAARAPGLPVFWDYHVVLASLDGEPAIWDLDTTLGLPVPFGAYLRRTFPGPHSEGPRPLFRTLAASDFLATFSTDRSHMLQSNGEYQAPPPPWPPPDRGLSNLGAFISPDPAVPGRVTDLAGLAAYGRKRGPEVS